MKGSPLKIAEEKQSLSCTCEVVRDTQKYTNTPHTFSDSEIPRIIAVQRKTWRSTQKHIFHSILCLLAPRTGLAHSRPSINTDWMNTRVEQRDPEAHKVTSRNRQRYIPWCSETCRTYTCGPASQPEPVHPFITPLSFSKSLVFFLSFTSVLYFMG